MSAYRTLAELSAFEPEQWRDWLRDGIGKWFSVSLDPLDFSPSDPRADVRRAAFRPFGITPRTVGVGVALGTSIKLDLHGAVARAAKGVGLLLDEWQVTADGARAAAALVSLAVSLQTPNLARKIMEVLHRPVLADNSGRRILAAAIIDAVIKRGSRREALDIARILNSKGWIEPDVAARLLPSLAMGQIEDLARHIAEFAPAMLSGDAPESAIEALAIEMRATKIWRPAPDRSHGQPGVELDAALELVRNLEKRASSRRLLGLDLVTRPEAFERAAEAAGQIGARLDVILAKSSAAGIWHQPEPSQMQ